MGLEPRATLILVLCPQGDPEKAYRSIVAESTDDPDDEYSQIKIGDFWYGHLLMDSEYEETLNVSAPEGSIILCDDLTVDTGERISWDDLRERQVEIARWAVEVAARHNCEWEIAVGARLV